MRMTRALVTITAAAVVGLAIGGGVVASASTGDTPKPVTQVANFETNAAGDTFGTYKLGGDRPDFVPGRTDTGRGGWFRLDDWYPETTKEGVPVSDVNAEVVPDENGAIKIPVYAQDGRTVIGSATIATVTSE